MKTLNIVFRVVLACIVPALLSSCSTKPSLPTEAERQEAIRQVPCIVVLPVETELREDPSVDFAQAAELRQGAAYMDTVIAGQLNGRSHVRILSSRQVTALIPEDSTVGNELIGRIAAEIKCNAVLVTSISEYRQRVGSNYGVDHPASVTFTMKLFDARQGTVLWSTMFSETQQSLLSNLMSLELVTKRGLRLITAEEMVEQGIIDKIRECPYL